MQVFDTTTAHLKNNPRRAKRKRTSGFLLMSTPDWQCVFYPESMCDPVMRGQRPIFREINNFTTLHEDVKNISRNDINIHQRVFRSILNKMKSRYSLLPEYLWRIAYRKGTAPPSSAKSPESKLGQWPSLTSDGVRGTINMSMRKCSHVFGLRTSKNQNRQISHYLYVSMGSSKVIDLRWPLKGQDAMSKVRRGHLLT